MKACTILPILLTSAALVSCSNHRESHGFGGMPVKTDKGSFRASYFDFQSAAPERARDQKAGNGFLLSESYSGDFEVHSPSGFTADDATLALIGARGKKSSPHPFKVGTVFLLEDPNSDPAVLAQDWNPGPEASQAKILQDFRSLIEGGAE